MAPLEISTCLSSSLTPWEALLGKLQGSKRFRKTSKALRGKGPYSGTLCPSYDKSIPGNHVALPQDAFPVPGNIKDCSKHLNVNLDWKVYNWSSHGILDEANSFAADYAVPMLHVATKEGRTTGGGRASVPYPRVGPSTT